MYRFVVFYSSFNPNFGNCIFRWMWTLLVVKYWLLFCTRQVTHKIYFSYDKKSGENHCTWECSTAGTGYCIWMKSSKLVTIHRIFSVLINKFHLDPNRKHQPTNENIQNIRISFWLMNVFIVLQTEIGRSVSRRWMNVKLHFWIGSFAQFHSINVDESYFIGDFHNF